jgi:hypothetical protein
MAWYTADSWNGRIWKDKSGNDYNASEVRGSIYTNRGKNFLYGDVSAGISFPPGILPNTYTLFHVASYTGGTNRRIFDGVDSNWLSGFYSGSSGVAYHGKWITPVSNNFKNYVVISTDQKNLYRGNGKNFTLNNIKGGKNDRLSINNGLWSGKGKNQNSSWRVFEVIVYDRELSITEIEKVEDYLRVKYDNYLTIY